jgi:hypothetical protein
MEESPPSKCTSAAGRTGHETCTCGHLFMAHRFRNATTIVACELCDLVEAEAIWSRPSSIPHFNAYVASVPPYTSNGQMVTADLLRGNHVLLALVPGEPPTPCAIEDPIHGGFLTLVDGVPTGVPVLEIHLRDSPLRAGMFLIFDKRTR